MWTVDLPSYIFITKRRKQGLSMNWYRDAHRKELHNAKVKFEQEMLQIVKDLKIPSLNKIHLHYVFYAPDRKTRDLGNIISVVDKFFCDILPKCGILKDDNVKFIVSMSAEYGGVDPLNPRVNVSIIPVTAPVSIVVTQCKD